MKTTEPEEGDFGLYMSVDDFRANGLLYILNKRILHPMGMALAANCDDEGKAIPEAPFILLGNGVKEWEFVRETDRHMAIVFTEFRKFFRAAAAGEIGTTDIRGDFKEINDGTSIPSDPRSASDSDIRGATDDEPSQEGELDETR